MSFDPYLRGRMRDPNIKSYAPAFIVGKPITNDGIGEVYASKNPKFKKGELVFLHIGAEKYSVISAKQLEGTTKDLDGYTKVDNKYNLPLSNYIGALGMPGLTA
jgi:NADPH-dependent curcumin reductase CurA